MSPSNIKSIVKDYCYQYVCQGEPKWPNNITLPENLIEDAMKNTVKQECDPVKALIDNKVILITLSSTPEKLYKCLEFILNRYEDEHLRYHPTDIRRRPLPKLFNILPKPATHWHSVTISVNALSSFVKNPLPRDYKNQLRLF